jgi:hypothetical protein
LSVLDLDATALLFGCDAGLKFSQLKLKLRFGYFFLVEIFRTDQSRG